MSTIDPNTIDPTKPAEGFPLTENVRANEQATQDNFAAAKADIEALEAQPGGREIQNEGVPLADQTLSAINVQGNAISVTANAAQDRYDFTANNAVINQLGGGAELFIGDFGSDPVTRELRTIIAGTGATVTQTATEIIIGATGAGGGEVNSAENIGVGLPIALEVNNGTLIPIRSLDASLFEESAGVITISAQTFADWTVAESHYDNANIHFPVSSLPGDGLAQNGSALDVDATVARRDAANTFTGNAVWRLSGGTSLVIESTDTFSTLELASGDGPPNARRFGHYATVDEYYLFPLNDAGDLSGSPLFQAEHAGGVSFGVSVIPGVGNVNMGAAFVDGQEVYWPGNPPPGSGGDVTSAFDTVDGEIQLGAVTAKGIKGLPRQAVGLPLISGGTGAGVGPSWSQIITSGIADAAVTFEKLETFGAETILLRGLGSGPPTDTKISALTNHTPAPTDYLLLETAAGLLRHSLVSALPGGGDVTSPGTTDNVVQLGSSDVKGIKDSAFLAAAVVLNDVSTTIDEVGMPWTVTDITGIGAAPSPTYAGNAAYYTNFAGAVDVQLDASAEGTLAMLIGTAVTGLSFTPTPDGQDGTHSPGGRSLVTVTRMASQTVVVIVPLS